MFCDARGGGWAEGAFQSLQRMSLFAQEFHGSLCQGGRIISQCSRSLRRWRHGTALVPLCVPTLPGVGGAATGVKWQMIHRDFKMIWKNCLMIRPSESTLPNNPPPPPGPSCVMAYLLQWLAPGKYNNPNTGRNGQKAKEQIANTSQLTFCFAEQQDNNSNATLHRRRNTSHNMASHCL